MGFFGSRLLLDFLNLLHVMVAGSWEGETVPGLVEGVIERGSALLAYQTQCPLEHGSGRLGGVLLLFDRGLRGKGINAQKLWSLLLQLPGADAACSGRVQDGARRGRINGQASSSGGEIGRGSS